MGLNMSKLCILIGGSTGLGAALVTVYENQGYELAEFSRSGDGNFHTTVDLARKESAIDLIDASFNELSKKNWSQVVLIINAAVLNPVGLLKDTEPKQWWANIEVNFTMPISILGRFQFHFSEKSYSKMVAFVSSGAAVKPFEGWSLYCSVKAGVEQFIQTMALEQSHEDYPIKCAILRPGIMDTNMQSDIRSFSEKEFRQVNQFSELYESGALTDPAHVAKNTFSKLSADFANGSVLDVSV